jgi:hypothetical protein
MKAFWARRVIFGPASLLSILAAACGDMAGVRPANGITVSVIARPASEPTLTNGPVGPVEIAGLQLVLGGVKLETAGLDATVDLVLAESRVVEVALGGEPVTAHTVIDVPVGTYKEIEISIDKLEPGNPAEEPLLATYSGLADASIAISGRVPVNGSEESFTFTAALDRDMEILLEPFLVITRDDGEPMEVRVTLALNTEGWFRDAAGEWLDPRDPANRSAIEANIQASFEAFEDGDMDGRPGPVGR